MNISFQQDNINSPLSQVFQPDIQSSDISQIRKGDFTRRMLLDQPNDQFLKNLNNRKDSITSINAIEKTVDNIQNNQNVIIDNDNQPIVISNVNYNQQKSNKNIPTLINNNSIGNALSFLKKTNNVKKFINLLKENAPQLNYKYLNKQHYKYINDKAFRRVHDNNHKFSYITNKICKKIFKIKIFKPDSKIMIIWDSLCLALAIFFVWISTIELSQQRIFTDEIPNLQQTYIVIITIFCIDIFVNLNMGYYDGFSIVEDNLKIIKNYFRHHFLIDALPIIGFYITKATQIYIFQFTSIFRIFKMISLINKIQENFHFQERFPTITTLTRLLLQIFFVAHLCGCGFVFIANNQSTKVETWIDRQNLTHAEFYEQYIVSLYYAFITMITVGYGDVVPVTIQERMYAIFMTLIACGIFAYSVNTIGQIVAQIEQKNAVEKKEKYEILNYMEGRNIRKDIQEKIFQYLQQLAQIQQQSSTQGILILNKLPSNLRNEIFQDFYGKLLKEQAFFTKNFSVELIEQLSLKMQENIIGPGQIIYNKNEIDRKIYIIKKGEVQFFDIINNQEKDFGKMGKSVMIGLPGFITGKARIHGTKSANITHIVSLDYEDFFQVIQQFPKDYEKYCMIKDQFLQNSLKITPFCTICNNTQHYTLQCPIVFYSPNSRLVISKYNYSQKQERQKLISRRKNKYKVFRNLQEIKCALKQLRVNLIIDSGQEEELNNSFLELLNNFGQETDKEFFQCTPIYIQPNNMGIDYKYQESFSSYEDQSEQLFLDSEPQQQQLSNLINEKDIQDIKQQTQINSKENIFSQIQQDNLSLTNLSTDKALQKVNGTDNKLDTLISSSKSSSSDIDDEERKEKSNLELQQINFQPIQQQSSYQKNFDDLPNSSILSLKQLMKQDEQVDQQSKQFNKQMSKNFSSEQQNQTKPILKQEKQENDNKNNNNNNNEIQKQIVQFSHIFRETIRNSLKGLPQTALLKDLDNQNKKKNSNFGQRQSIQQQIQNNAQRNSYSNRSSLSKNILKQQLDNTNQMETLQDMIADLENNFTKQLNKLLNNNNNNNSNQQQNQFKQLKSFSSINKTNNNTEEQQEFFTIKFFDKMQKFNIYYPQYNYTNISKLQNKKKQTRKYQINKGTIIMNMNKNLIRKFQ